MTEAVFFKIGVLKMAFRPTTLLKWDYNTGFFLWDLQSF